MKIVEVIPNFIIGGAETMCETLINALIKKGQEVVVVSLYSDRTIITDRLEKSGIKLYYLDKRLGPDISVVKKLIKILKKEKPDVVHAHLYAVSYAMVAAVITGCRKKVTTIHTLAEEDNTNLGRIFNKILFSLCGVIPVALNKKVQQSIIKEYNISSENVPIVYNGIDLTKCVPKKKYDIEGDYTLLHVGRFAEVKNHITIIDALYKVKEMVPNVELVLVGNGELFENIKMYVDEKGLDDCVKFEGSQANVYPYYTDADIFLLPSLYEGMPMSIIEAMASALPIIASNVGGIADIVENNKTGLLIEPTVNELKDAIIDLINDKEKRQRLGQNGLDDVQKYSSTIMAEKYIDIFERSR